MRKNKVVLKTNNLGRHLIIVILVLLTFGLINIYNATSYFSQSEFGGPFIFVFQQLAWIILGFLGFVIFANFDYHKLKSFSFLLFGGSLLLLFILAVVGVFVCNDSSDVGSAFIPCINGASRWFFLNPKPLPQIPFVGVVGIQPSEIAKLAIILYLATQLEKFEKNIKKDFDPFIVYISVALLFSFLLILQPNMSTAVLVFAIATVIYLVSGNSIKYLFYSIPFLVISGLVVIFVSEYRRERFLTLLGMSKGDSLQTGYHMKQILIALGSGGFFGVGFGQSRQKFQYLPEVASDSIFAIIGEEFGFLGTTAILLIFGYLIYLGYKIAINAEDLLGKMLAMGITTWISVQLFINIAAMTRLIPITGMPIPFISYGGSSTVFSLMALGILYNIQKHTSES